MTDPITAAEEIGWIKTSTTYDTPVAFVAADAIKCMELKIAPTLNLVEINERTGSQSYTGEIAGRIGGTFSMKVIARTGALGVAPDDDPAREAAFGAAGVDTPSTSVVWSLGAASAAARTLQVGRSNGVGSFEIASGIKIDKMELVLPESDGHTEITYSGTFADYGFVRAGLTVSGGHSSSDTTIQLSANAYRRLRPGVTIKFGSEDNSGAGYLVTAVDADTDIITISPALANNISNGDAVTASIPTPSTSGTPTGSVSCALTIDGNDVPCKSATIALETGLAEAKEATANKPTRVTKTAKRTVRASFVVFDLDETTDLRGGAWNLDDHDVSLRIGPDIAGRRLTIDIPKIVFAVAELDIPDADAAGFVLTGRAQQDAAANDEMEWTQT